MDRVELSSKPIEHGQQKLNLSRADQVVDSWPDWKRNMADQILRPSPQPRVRNQPDRSSCGTSQ